MEQLGNFNVPGTVSKNSGLIDDTKKQFKPKTHYFSEKV